MINMETNRNRLSGDLLYIGSTVMLIKVICGYSIIINYTDFMDNILVFLSVAILTASIISQKIIIKRFFIYVILSLLMVLLGYRTGNYGLTITAIACFALRGKNFNEFLRYMFKVILIIVIIHLLYFAVHFVLGTGKIYTTSYRSGTETRYNLGFTHANIASVVFFNLSLMWFWLNFERFNKKHIIVFLLTSFFIYKMTVTRTVIVETIITILIFTIGRLKENKALLLRLAIFIIFPVCLILVYLFATHYFEDGEYISYKFVRHVDTLLSSRIKFAAYANQKWGITWFGRNITDFKMVWDPKWQLNGFTFDCIYSYLIYNVGIVWGILMIILLIVVAVFGSKKICMFMLIWCIYGITEVHGLNGFMLFPIFLITQINKNTKCNSWEN